MHLFNMATVFIVLSLVSVEFSVAIFVDPAALRLDPEPQLKLLSRLASVLGKVMPSGIPLVRYCSLSRLGCIGTLRLHCRKCLQQS